MNDTIQISVPKRALVDAFLEKVARASAPGEVSLLQDLPLRVVPAIGEAFQGGKYAGLTVHDNDPHELVLLPGEFKGPWEKAKAWAAEQGGTLPSRHDMLVLFKNLRAKFQRDWYWTSEEVAGYADYAWIQTFSYGDQYGLLKSNDFRCRAVRRVAI